MTRYLVVFGIALGILIGVGGYTFIYARGAAYLTNDPQACANCHVMSEQYGGWVKSSHRAVAVCNDCHTPPDLVGKYVTKAVNGWNHSFAFTTGRYPDEIIIGPRNREITERACGKCHQAIVQTIGGPSGHGGGVACLRCHASVGHLE